MIASVTILAISISIFGMLQTSEAAKPVATSTGLLPNLMTAVPKHLQVQNSQQTETLRFSNGIANVGPGALQLRPVFPPDASGTQDAYQDILDANGNIVSTRLASQYDFHPEHNHWHIADVAEFSVHKDSPTGPQIGNSLKVTFCLIDWYKMDDNSNTKDRVYFDCETGLQGISKGWIDQYHQSLADQEIDITNAPPGDYYLVSTANFAGRFLETNYDDNTAWLHFQISRDSKGNAKITELDNSECHISEDPAYWDALCGNIPLNR